MRHVYIILLIILYVSGLRPYIYSYLFFTNISVLRTYFLSKNYLQGAEPRYVCRIQQKSISSAVGATRKLFYTCQGYAPIYIFISVFYKHLCATHLFVMNYLSGASSRYVCRIRKKYLDHSRCDTTIILYNNFMHVRATPLYLYSYHFLFKHFGATHLI